MASLSSSKPVLVFFLSFYLSFSIILCYFSIFFPFFSFSIFQPPSQPPHVSTQRAPSSSSSKHTSPAGQIPIPPQCHPSGVAPVSECCNSPVSFPLDWLVHPVAGERRWYISRRGTARNDPPDFAICGACMGAVVTALGGREHFIPRPGTSRGSSGSFLCCFSTSHPRWQQFLQYLGEALLTGKPDALERGAVYEHHVRQVAGDDDSGPQAGGARGGRAWL